MIHLYSIHGNTLKDEGRTIDVKGEVTGMAYSDDGAHLAVINDKKAALLYSVADDYAVNTYRTLFFVARISFITGESSFILLSCSSKMNITHTTPNQSPWPGAPIMSTLQPAGWT